MSKNHDWRMTKQFLNILNLNKHMSYSFSKQFVENQCLMQNASEIKIEKL